MSSITWIPAGRNGSGRAIWGFARRVPRILWIMLAIVLSWSAEVALYRSLEPPGQVLRHELEGAAGELDAQFVPRSTPQLAETIRRHFREAVVAIDVDRDWPNVVVSLGGLSQTACLAALSQARRIDGPVVIRLEGYRSVADCRARNQMSWLLMP
ncbi:MAG TPA: hypothetical protein VN668_22340 [Stellaceae bacterium]|nr:hypothetical protein [Stellaceae bacterium]